MHWETQGKLLHRIGEGDMSKRDELIAIAKGKRLGYWIERHRRERGKPDVFCIRTPYERNAPIVLYEWSGIGIDAEYLGLTKDQAISLPIYDHVEESDERRCLIAPVELLKMLLSIKERCRTSTQI